MSGVARSFGWLALTALAVGCSSKPPPPAPAPVEEVADLPKQVRGFCGTACHAYPPPDTFPRSAWRMEVERGYRFFEQSGLPLKAPPLEQVVKYYEDRAPLELPKAVMPRAARPFPVRWTKLSPPGPAVPREPATANVNLAPLFSKDRLDVLACDMKNGQVLALPGADLERGAWRVLASGEEVSNPAHAEVVDLDGDKINDVIVANLGSYPPTDQRCGSVVWLRGQKDGTFKPITLLKGVGRVADVQAGHFMGTDKLDLVVAVFGWHTTGAVMLLENQTTDWDHPKFVPHVLDERTGAIHVPVADLNRDGRPDFVTVLAQEHETVVAFINTGKGTGKDRFRKHTLYTAPHPGYGSSGIQLVDLDRDGKLDVLYTNGDTLDEPYLFKPYHGIQWLRNETTDWDRPKFTHHHLAAMYGVHRAVAANLRGDGLLDVVAVSFLPVTGFPRRKERNADAVVVLEQTAPGKFERHPLESVTCDHVTCVAGKLFGTRRDDLVVGNFSAAGMRAPATNWRNEGLTAKARGPGRRPLLSLGLRDR